MFARSKDTLYLQDNDGCYTFDDRSYAPASAVSRGGDQHVRAAMDGAIVDLRVTQGQAVNAGDVVAVLEAMKMAHQLKASIDGVVEKVSVELGQQVKARQILVTLEAKQEAME